MRQRVHRAIKALDPHAIENLCGRGTPDTTYAYGWIELKALKEWPKRDSTPVRLHHDLMREQRIWLRRRWQAGGEAYVLLLVEKTQDWLIFDGPTAGTIIGDATQEELREAAIAVWSRREMEKYLESFLRGMAIQRMTGG